MPALQRMIPGGEGGGEEVVGAVVLNADQALDAQTLRQRLKEQLSAYKVPSRVFFCAREEIPFTDSGKVDKQRLITILASIDTQ